MTKTVNLIILVMAMVLLFYTPILAGEKYKERTYRSEPYWVFKSDADASKSGWRQNDQWGTGYSSRSYGGNGNHKDGEGNREGRGGKKNK